ncbi:MAG: response regulator [Lachnospiraceae bacterium]|nr:response regulator [Lachnospiraceae bacterium]
MSPRELQQKDDISLYINDQEYIANNYVMKCFTVTMIVYATAFILNIMGIFVIRQDLMLKAFIPSVAIYVISFIVSKIMLPSNRIKKYIILSGSIYVFTITGVFITYHAILVTLLPFLYAALYSSKRVMTFVYIMTTISTVVIVYCGYFFGLCDANMLLLTTGTVSDYVVNGVLTLMEVNPNPAVSLFLFFILPRCLIYVAFMAVCNSIFRIVSGSLEKARLSEELARAKEEAELANKAKSKFLARMSHEIRTPINAIFGMNEMIIRESEEPAIRKYAKDVKDSSELLLNIVNDILDSSKIESGMMELVESEYDIQTLLNDLHNMTIIKAKEKNLDLEFIVDQSLPCKYHGDDQRIRQVLLNLLSNGVKYTNHGKITLQVSGERQGEYAVLHYSVRDTGMGIREEDIDKLYDEFRRFDIDKNRYVEGTGLGITIAQQFLKLMGSELQIHSEYEKGSEFSFKLVQQIVDETPIKDLEQKFNPSASEEKKQLRFTAEKAKILVVDDYQMNIKVFKNLVKFAKMQISEAISGNECLELLEKQKFDVIFLDHMMPGLDGIETLRIIRQRNLCENVPIIMLTANAIIGDKERYLEEGFDDFLSKPIIPELLTEMLLKYLPPEYIVSEGDNKLKPQTVTPENSNISKQNKEEDETTMIKVTQEEHFEAVRAALPELNYEAGLNTCMGDEDFYLELLTDFSELPIKAELSKLLADKDAANYAIQVHGFKNNAYTIGAKEIGDLAYELEKLTKAADWTNVPELQDQMFRLYDSVCERFNAIVVV